MKKWLILGFISACLAFQFQNCEQGQQSSASSSVSDGNSKVQSSPSHNDDIFDLSTLLAVDSTSSRVAFNVRIDVASKRFKLLDASGNPSNQNYCLNTDEENELSDFLQKAQMCPATHGAADQICAAFYIAPYARLVGSQGSQLIGEVRSACDKGQDLCQDSAAQIAGLLDALTKETPSSLASRACN